MCQWQLCSALNQKSVSESFTDWQFHLLSCPEQLKEKHNMIWYPPGEEIGPVEEIEDGKDAGKENSGEHVDLLRRKLEVAEPGGHSVRRDSEEKEDSEKVLSLSYIMLSANTKA